MTTITALGAVIGLIVAIVLIMRKVNPAYSLILGSIVGGLVGGANIQDTVGLMISGAQGMIPAILRIITAGVLAGVLIETGAAKKIAETIVNKLGETKAVIAIVISAMILTMVGVFIDTILVCTATALSILVTGAYNVQGANGKYLVGAQLTQGAFKLSFGEFGAILLAVCLAFFAFTTIIGWYYFGESNIKYLFGTKALLPYRIIVIICIIAGSLQEVEIVWSLADIFNSLMVIPNLIAIVWLSFEVKALLKDYNKKFEEGNVYYDYKDE